MSTKEKKMAIIILLTIIGWSTYSFHGLTPSIIGFISVIVMKFTGILSKTTLQRKMRWGSLIFIGFVLNLRNIISYLGIDIFLQNHIENFFESIAVNHYRFALSIVLITFLLRFFIVSMNALCVILLTVLVPIAVNTNLNPWCFGILIFMSAQALWILPYQNIPINVAHQASDGRMVRDKDFIITSLIYFSINVVTTLVLVSYWNLIGIIKI